MNNRKENKEKRDRSKCAICGDTPTLQDEEGRVSGKFETSTIDNLQRCKRCHSYRWCKGNEERPKYLWAPSLREHVDTACYNCHEQDPALVSRRKVGLFSCRLCLDYRSSHLKKHLLNPDRPRELWAPHLRLKLQCRACGRVEGCDSITVAVRAIREPGYQQWSFCDACWSPRTSKMRGHRDELKKHLRYPMFYNETTMAVAAKKHKPWVRYKVPMKNGKVSRPRKTSKSTGTVNPMSTETVNPMSTETVNPMSTETVNLMSMQTVNATPEPSLSEWDYDGPEKPPSPEYWMHCKYILHYGGPARGHRGFSLSKTTETMIYKCSDPLANGSFYSPMVQRL